MEIQEFVDELSKLKSSSTFLTLRGYRNESGEIADYSIIFNMSYKNALQKSIMTLESLTPKDALEALALKDLLDGYKSSLIKSSSNNEDSDESYTRFFDEDGVAIKGIKLHKASGMIHLYGLVVHKRITMPGNYSKRKKRSLTLVKDQLRKLVPLSKFRQFIIDESRVNSISVQNIELLPPNTKEFELS